MTTDAPHDPAEGPKDGLEEHIQQEFVEEARDVLNELDVTVGNVRSHAVTSEAALGQIRRHCHNLLAGARAVSLPAVETVVHRLEDYVTDLKDLPAGQLDDVQAFLDKLRAALEGEVAVGELSQVVRQLPARKTFDIGDIELLDIEVMLINPQRTAARFVERELQACGYRVVNARSSFEAIALAVRGQPDLIISSAVLDELTGVDLACAFSSMPKTEQIPFALLTSFGWGHPSLERLPSRVAILRVGTHFGDDLAEALSRFKIT
jgi:HPt (histidine-containing phosphotransfer) domain-containing protein